MLPRGPQCSPAGVFVTARLNRRLSAAHYLIYYIRLLLLLLWWWCGFLGGFLGFAVGSAADKTRRDCIHVSGTRHADVRDFSSALHSGRISVRWVTQLSKIAVTQFQDQTQSMRKGLWVEETQEISGNPLNYPNKDEQKRKKKTHTQKKRRERSAFWWVRIFEYSDTHCGYLEKRREEEKKKTHCTNTKTIFICAWRGKSGHFRTEMKTKKGRLDALEKKKSIEISFDKQKTTRTETINRAISLICKPCSLLFPFQTWQGAFSAMCWRDVKSRLCPFLLDISPDMFYLRFGLITHGSLNMCALLFLSRCNWVNLQAHASVKTESNGASIFFKFELIWVTAAGDTFESKFERSAGSKLKFGDCTEFETLNRFLQRSSIKLLYSVSFAHFKVALNPKCRLMFILTSLWEVAVALLHSWTSWCSAHTHNRNPLTSYLNLQNLCLRGLKRLFLSTLSNCELLDALN